MFPIKDDNQTKKRPVVTYSIIFINVAIFILTIATGVYENTIFEFGMRPAEIFLGSKLHTLITSMFLHGGVLHILFNMWYLWIFGDNVEEYMGRKKFIVFYVTSGVVAGLAHAISDPGSSVPTIGASGAISAVLGAYIVLYPWADVYTAVIFLYFLRVVTIPAVVVIGVWFALQLLSGSVTWISGISTGVAYWAHIGGFVFGLAVGLIAKNIKKHGGENIQVTA